MDVAYKKDVQKDMLWSMDDGCTIKTNMRSRQSRTGAKIINVVQNAQ